MVTMFEVGQDVVVAQRQWPGVNKEGGPGRVSKINSDGTLAVAYIIGNRSEARVPLKVRSTLVGTGSCVLYTRKASGGL